MNNNEVEVRIIGSPKEFASRDLNDQSLVAKAIREHVLPATKKEYQRVDVKIMREDHTPGHLVAYLLRKDIYLVEVVRVDVDSQLNVKGVQFNYIEPKDSKEAQEGKDYGEFDFVVGSPVPEIPTAKAAVEFLYDLLTKAGFKCMKLLGPDANLANYKNYLGSVLVGFVNVGHGNTQGFALSDGFLDYNWFQSLTNKPLKPAVVYFNSCQTFNNPLLPTIIQAGARTFIGGIVNLLIGPSEAVCMCFWDSILKSKSQLGMVDALKQCEKNKYPTPGSHGITGDTGPFAPASADLTGVWNCDDGGKYYLRQLTNMIWWYGEANPTSPRWSNVMKGAIEGNTINGNWADVPKGSVMSSGIMVLSIESNNRLRASKKTGGFGGSVWTR
jgi:hypothetical protein